MSKLEVKYTKVISSATGQVREGWIVFEDGQPSYPFDSKEKAVRHAEGLKSIRCAPNVRIQVYER